MNTDNINSAPIGVFGLGNVLMGDDALGPTVIAELRAGYDFPPEVHVEDLGTPGLDLHPHLSSRSHIILVDVVKSQGDPGELRLYRRDEILKHAPEVRTSPHDPGVKEALLSLEFSGEVPAVFLVGVIPDKVAHATGMTDRIRAAVPAAEKAILAELEALGFPAVPREPRGQPDLWWEVAGG
jgi:hydrogenase maturation protease